jgi:hypothetical protein
VAIAVAGAVISEERIEPACVASSICTSSCLANLPRTASEQIWYVPFIAVGAVMTALARPPAFTRLAMPMLPPTAFFGR